MEHVHAVNSVRLGCLQEVCWEGDTDRVSRGRRVILLTLRCEGWSFFVARAMDSMRLWMCCVLFRGGDAICGMCMDLTDAFCVAGAMNS